MGVIYGIFKLRFQLAAAKEMTQCNCCTDLKNESENRQKGSRCEEEVGVQVAYRLRKLQISVIQVFLLPFGGAAVVIICWLNKHLNACDPSPCTICSDWPRLCFKLNLSSTKVSQNVHRGFKAQSGLGSLTET